MTSEKNEKIIFEYFTDKPKGKEFVENLIGAYNRNVLETFEEYLDRLEEIFLLHNIPKEQHAEILLSLTVECPDDYRDLTYHKLKQLLQVILNLGTGVKESRLKFFNRKQLEDESICEYVATLKRLAQGCHFEDDAFGDVIRDTFINGVRSGRVMNEISKKKEMSLDKILRIAVNKEKEEKVIENVLNFELCEKSTRTFPRKNSIQCKNVRSIDLTKDGCISDKLKVNLPGKEAMIECIVELQWFMNNSNSPNAGILMVFQQSKENILWRINLSDVTCILNCSEPGKTYCAVYTAEIIQDDFPTRPLNVFFFDKEKLQDWFHRASKVLCQVNGSPKIPKNGSIWSTTALGDIYLSDAESLQKNQSTMNDRFIKEYDCKQYKNPFRIELINGFPINTAITIHGKVHQNPDRFFINLFCGFNQNIAFHFNPRYDEMEIVRNTYTEEGYWGPEEREGLFIIERGSNFILTILCLDEKFKISVNGKWYTYYYHRVPYSTITHVEIGGDVNVCSILYESNKAIVHLPDLKWRKIQGNLWKVETCSAGITWGLGFNYFPFVFIGDSSQELNINKSSLIDVDLWRMVGSTKLRDLSLGVFHGVADSKIISLWAVSASGNVLYRSEVTTECIEGEKWIEVPTDQTITCIATSNRRQVWICGENGICYWRFGITATNPKGEAWRSIEPIDGRFFEKIAICKFTIWALDSQGDLFIRKETIPDVPASAEWHKIKNPDHKRFKHISANENDVWAICTAGMMYRRVGMSEENPEGISWNCGSLPGNFLHVSE